MKYSYTRQGNQLRFKYCPICNKIKENPDFTINIAEGVYFCFSNNIGGRIEELSKYGFDIGEIPELRGFYRVETKNNGSLRGDNPLNSFSNNIGGRIEELSKYGFDIGEIPELRGFYRVETKNNGSLRGDNPLNSKDSSLNGENKKYYEDGGETPRNIVGNIENLENKNRGLGGEIPLDFKYGSLVGDKTLSNGRANNFTDNNSFNKRRVENSWTSDSKESKNYKSKKNIDLTSIFLARKNNFLNDEWIKYLLSRGISDKYLKKFARLGKSNTMMMPLTNGKKVIGIKYRTIDKKIFSERESQSDYLLGWQLVKDFSYIIIVEGEIDLLSALEVGFESVVSLPFGAGNLKAIENQKDWLSSFEKIIIATDSDTQGKKSKDEIVKILSNV